VVSAKTEGAQRGAVLSRESTAQHSIEQHSTEQHSIEQHSTKQNTTATLPAGEGEPPPPESEPGSVTRTQNRGEFPLQNAPLSPAHPARAGCAPIGNRHDDAQCPPTQKQVADYCCARESPVDPDRFFDYYTARGWLAGAGKITDWKACLRSWEHTGGALRVLTAQAGGVKSTGNPDADKLSRMIEEKFMRKKEEDCP
jgi:hypothetical protein